MPSRTSNGQKFAGGEEGKDCRKGAFWARSDLVIDGESGESTEADSREESSQWRRECKGA